MSVDPELAELYQELIRDHSRHPHNFSRPEKTNAEAEGYNPLCGDHFSVHLVLDAHRIVQTGFTGCGCAISTSSASMMTDAVLGKTKEEALELFDQVHRMLTGRRIEHSEDLGKLESLAGIQNFPLRVKCASLAWHTLKACLQGEKIQ